MKKKKILIRQIKGGVTQHQSALWKKQRKQSRRNDEQDCRKFPGIEEL